MGGVLCGKLEKAPSLQRLKYDLTPVRDKNLPLVWLVGPPCSGVLTHTELLEERLHYSAIIVSDLLQEEAYKDTDRGKILRKTLKDKAVTIPDTIIIDLIKERMIQTLPKAKGYLISYFPHTQKQALLFEAEIAHVHTIIFLQADVNLLVQRQIAKDEKQEPRQIKKKVNEYNRRTNAALRSFSDKVEKISTTGPVGDTYGKIQGAIYIHYKAKNPNSDIVDPSAQPIDQLVLQSKAAVTELPNVDHSTKGDIKSDSHIY